MNRRWCYLSHILRPEAPAYGGVQAFHDAPDKRMSAGDSCNTRNWSLSNHMGTHIDFPRHFALGGRTCDSYPADFWLFARTGVVVLDHVQPRQILTEQDLSFSGIPVDVELLLIQTGFGRLRAEPVYWQSNPGLHPDLAEDLRRNFPSLRVVGFDFLSLSSFAHRELGREAHRAFLDHPRPILPLEDMDLSPINPGSAIRQVLVAPLRSQNADGAPCTVLAEVAE